MPFAQYPGFEASCDRLSALSPDVLASWLDFVSSCGGIGRA